MSERTASARDPQGATIMPNKNNNLDANTGIGSATLLRDPRRSIAERLAIAAYLEDAISEMRKRVWAPYGSRAKLVEMKDGAVPCWWLKQEIDRLRLPNAQR